MKRIPWIDVALSLALFLLNVVLTYPLFLPGDAPYRDSIEGGYVAMARYIDAHPNPWGWNPLQYCGLPTQFLYLPALHYAVALLPVDPAYGYKLLTAALACLGPVTLYIACVFFTGSRVWALVTALAYTFYSPIYGLVSQADKDRGVAYLPWRLHVFAKYGEAPHNAGLTLLPLTWIALAKTATRRRYTDIFVLALLMAGTTLTNWVAALALAMTCLVFMAAAIGWPGFEIRRILVAGVLAYGLACFWLTPTFIRTIAFNWPADAFDYKLQAAQYRLLAWYIVLFVALWLTMRWLQWPLWEKFLTLAVYTFGYPVMMHYGLGIDMIPESRRYAIEFELFLIAALAAFLRFAMAGSNRVRQACAVVAVLAFLIGGAAQLRKYVVQPRSPFSPVPVERTPEYKVASWIASQKPQGRVLASGGLRFRLNSWFDIPQVGGTFESGLRNRTPVHFAYHIRTDDETTGSIREMQALGVEYVVVHGRQSAEHYRDYKNPAKFDGVLEKVYDDGADVVYRVPFRGLAHAIRPDEEPDRAHRDAISPYIQAIEDPSRPQFSSRWIDVSHLRLEGALPPGMLLSVQVTYDEGWSASSAGRRIPVEKDSLGFIKLRNMDGPVDLVYGGSTEQKWFALLSGLTWVGALALLWKNRA
jgi:hypothetical protein